MHLRSYYKAYKFPVIFTRAANVYGPGQQLYRIIPRTILSIKKNKIDITRRWKLKEIFCTLRT